MADPANTKSDQEKVERFAEFFAAAMRGNNNTVFGRSRAARDVSLEWIPKWEDWKTHFGHIAMANGGRTSSAEWIYQPVSPFGHWTSSPRCPKCIKPEWIDSHHPRCKGFWAI